AGERSSRLAFLHVPYDDDLRLTYLVGYPRTSAPEPFFSYYFKMFNNSLFIRTFIQEKQSRDYLPAPYIH
ncbi:hypothetical protein ACTQ1R_15060, partial [Prevotellaceae bacterium LCP21S3_C11]